jgi:hypothetical protein
MSRATASFFPTISLYVALTFSQTTVFAAAGDMRPRDPCPRPVAGSIVVRPPDLFSKDGVWRLTTSRRSMTLAEPFFVSGPRTG